MGDNQMKIPPAQVVETSTQRQKKPRVTIRNKALLSSTSQSEVINDKRARIRFNIFASSPTTDPDSNAQPATNETIETNEPTEQTSSSPQNVEVADSDDDVVIVHDAGINPLFPDAPKISKNFQEYLSLLQTQDVENIKALRRMPPPVRLAGGAKQSISHLYITVNDLLEIKLEMTRTLEQMSEDDRREFAINPQASFRMLILHEHLTSCILRAKQRCVRDYQLSMKFLAPFTPDIMAPIHEIGHSLYWQTGVFNDLYRQAVMTTFSNKDAATQSNNSSSSGRKPRKRASTKTDAEQRQDKQPNAKNNRAKKSRKPKNQNPSI